MPSLGMIHQVQASQTENIKISLVSVGGVGGGGEEGAREHPPAEKRYSQKRTIGGGRFLSACV